MAAPRLRWFIQLCKDWCQNKAPPSRKYSRKLHLALAFLALMLDNLLMTVVVPIIPEYLSKLDTDDALVELRDDLGLDGNDLDELSSMHWFNHTQLSVAQYEYIFNMSLYQNFTDLVSPAVYAHDSSRVGWLFASKAMVQLLANPIVGILVSRIGYSLPLCSGSAVICLSSLLFACGQSYVVLFLARTVQGIGSSLTAIAGMTMLAEIYSEDNERSKAMGIALGGLALGVIVGYPMGSIMYQFLGKASPFLVIMSLVLAELGLQVWILQPKPRNKVASAGTTLTSLLKDPYILLVSGAILLPEMAMAILESALPLWLIHTINPPQWQLGVVFLPDSIGFWLGCNLFGVLAIKLGRWIVTAVALLFTGICLLCIPLATEISHLIVPHFFLGLAIGMVDAALMPLLALLVESRHVAVYGNVYAIGQVSVSLAFALGPSLGGQLVEWLGFTWLLRGVAILNLVYLPLCYFLRQPPVGDESQCILSNEQEERVITRNDSFVYNKLNDD